MVAFVAWTGLVFGIVAIAYAVKLQQELGVVRGRLDRYNRALFNADDGIRRLQDELVEAKASLRVEMLQRTGDSGVGAEMTLREIRLIHPQADEVLAGFHIGGCSSCAAEPDDTLAVVCQQSSVNVDTVVHNLNMLVGQGLPTTAQVPVAVKLPNVHLEL